MKKPTKRLSLTTETIRNLQSDELTRVVGGSASISIGGTSVIHPSTAPSTSVISRLPISPINTSGIVVH
jgi:hypothetical protein